MAGHTLHNAFEMFISLRAPARQRPADPESTSATTAQRVRYSPLAVEGVLVFLPESSPRIVYPVTRFTGGGQKVFFFCAASYLVSPRSLVTSHFVHSGLSRMQVNIWHFSFLLLFPIRSRSRTPDSVAVRVPLRPLILPLRFLDNLTCPNVLMRWPYVAKASRPPRCVHASELSSGEWHDENIRNRAYY